MAEDLETLLQQRLAQTQAETDRLLSGSSQQNNTNALSGPLIIQDGDTVNNKRLDGFDTFESLLGSTKSQNIADNYGVSLEEQQRLGLLGKQALKGNLANNNYQFDKTGRGFYLRDIVNNDQLTQQMIESGYAVPTNRYDQKTQNLYRRAQEKRIKQGSTDVNAFEAQRQYNLDATAPSYFDRLSNSVDAFQSGTIQAAGSFGDFVLDVLTPAAFTADGSGDNKWLNEFKSAEYADKAVGYDRREATFQMEEAKYDWDNGNYGSAILRALTTPEVVAESLPIMLEMLVGGGKFKLGAAAIKAAQTGLTGAKATEAALAAEKALPVLTKAANYGIKNAGFLAVVSQTTNNDIDKFTENNGGVGPSPLQVAGMTAVNGLTYGLDKAVFLDVVKSPGALKSFKEAMTGLAQGAPAKALLGMGTTAATVAKGMTEEAGQEYLQTWGEILNQKGNTKDFGNNTDVLNSAEAQSEATTAAIFGAGAAGQISGVSQAAVGATQGVKKGLSAISNSTNVDETPPVVPEPILDAEGNPVLNADGTPQVQIPFDEVKRVVTSHVEGIQNLLNSPETKGIVDGTTELTEEEKTATSADISIMTTDLIDYLKRVRADGKNLGQSAEEIANAEDALIKATVFKRDRLDGNKPVLNNRPLVDIVKDIEALPEDVDPQVKANLENERIVSEYFQGDKVFIATTPDKKATEQQAKQLKFYGGNINGSPRTGLLEWAQLLNDPTLESSVREATLNRLNNFVSSQRAKLDALEAAGREFDATGEAVSFKYPGKDGGNGTYHRGSEPFLKALQAEMEVFDKVLANTNISSTVTPTQTPITPEVTTPTVLESTQTTPSSDRLLPVTVEEAQTDYNDAKEYADSLSPSDPEYTLAVSRVGEAANDLQTLRDSTPDTSNNTVTQKQARTNYTNAKKYLGSLGATDPKYQEAVDGVTKAEKELQTFSTKTKASNQPTPIVPQTPTSVVTKPTTPKLTKKAAQSIYTKAKKLYASDKTDVNKKALDDAEAALKSFSTNRKKRRPKKQTNSLFDGVTEELTVSSTPTTKPPVPKKSTKSPTSKGTTLKKSTPLQLEVARIDALGGSQDQITEAIAYNFKNDKNDFTDYSKLQGNIDELNSLYDRDQALVEDPVALRQEAEDAFGTPPPAPTVEETPTTTKGNPDEKLTTDEKITPTKKESTGEGKPKPTSSTKQTKSTPKVTLTSDEQEIAILEVDIEALNQTKREHLTVIKATIEDVLGLKLPKGIKTAKAILEFVEERTAQKRNNRQGEVNFNKTVKIRSIIRDANNTAKELKKLLDNIDAQIVTAQDKIDVNSAIGEVIADAKKEVESVRSRNTRVALKRVSESSPNKVKAVAELTSELSTVEDFISQSIEQLNTIKAESTIGAKVLATMELPKNKVKDKTQYKKLASSIVRYTTEKKKGSNAVYVSPLKNDNLYNTTLSTYFKAGKTTSKIYNYANQLASYLKSTDITDGKFVKAAAGVVTSLENALSSLAKTDALSNKTTITDIFEAPKGGKSWFSVSRLLFKPVYEKNPYNDGGGKFKLSHYDLPPEVAKVISLATLDWLANTAGSTRSSVRSDEELRRMLGEDSKYQLSDADKQLFSEFDNVTNFGANSIGSLAYKNLGLKAKEGTNGVNTAYIEAKMKTELGLLGMMMAQEAGYITLNAKPVPKKGEPTYSPDFADTFTEGYQVSPYVVYGEHVKEIGLNPNVTISTYSVTPKGDKVIDKGGQSGFAGLAKAMEVERNSTGPYTAPEDAKTPRDEIVNEGVSGKLENSVPEQFKDAIEKQESTASTFNPRFLETYKEVEDSIGEGELGKIFGINEEVDAAHVINRAGIRGKNLGIKDEMRYFKEAVEEFEGKPMWFKWYVMTNNRFGIKSNTFNIQDKKLHRFSVIRNMIKIKPDSVEETQFKLAIGQALGVDVDKQSNKANIKEIDELLGTILNLLDEGLTTAEIYQYFTGSKDKTAPFSGNGGGDKYHALLGVAEAIAYLKHIDVDAKNTEPFESGMMLETDAITSGYILKLLQMPIFQDNDKFTGIERVKTAISKGGIMDYKEDAEGNMTNPTYGEQAEQKGYTDAYNTPAKTFSDKLTDQINGEGLPESMTPFLKEAISKSIKASVQLVGESVTETGGKDATAKGIAVSISRAFMKDPFMIFNYGSAIKSIVASLGRKSIENFYTLMEKSATNIDPRDEEGIKSQNADRELMYQVLSSSANLLPNNSTFVKDNGDGSKSAKYKAMDSYIAYLKALPQEQLIEEVLPKEVSTAIAETTEKNLGPSLEATFKEEYAEFIESTAIINSSFALMFKAALPVINEGIRKAEDVKNKDRAGKARTPLTPKEVDEVIGGLSDVLPVLEVPLSLDEDGKRSQLLIAKEQAGEYAVTKEGGYNIDNKAKVSDNNNSGLYGISTLYKLVEAYASGAVIPIHTMDGSIQSSVLSKFTSIGVHDANFFDVETVVEGTTEYNKATIDIAKAYSMTTKILESMYNSLNSVDTKAIKALDKEIISSSLSSSMFNSVIKAVPPNTSFSVLRKDMDYIADKVATAVINDKLHSDTASLLKFVSMLNKDSNEVSQDLGVDGVAALQNLLVGENITEEEVQDILTFESLRDRVNRLEQLQKRSEDGRVELFNNNRQYVEHAALEGAGYVTDAEEYVRQEPKAVLKSEHVEYLNNRAPSPTGQIEIKKNIMKTLLGTCK